MKTSTKVKIGAGVVGTIKGALMYASAAFAQCTGCGGPPPAPPEPPVVVGPPPQQPGSGGQGGAGGAGGSAGASASAASQSSATGGSATLTGGNLSTSSKVLVLPSVSLPGAAPVAAPNLVVSGGSVGGAGGSDPGAEYARRVAVCTAYAYEGKSKQATLYVIGAGSAKGGTNTEKYNTCMANGVKPKQEDRAFNIADEQCDKGNANTYNAVLGKAGELGDEYSAAMQGTIVCAAQPKAEPDKPAFVVTQDDSVGAVSPRRRVVDGTPKLTQ